MGFGEGTCGNLHRDVEVHLEKRDGFGGDRKGLSGYSGHEECSTERIAEPFLARPRTKMEARGFARRSPEEERVGEFVTDAEAFPVSGQIATNRKVKITPAPRRKWIDDDRESVIVLRKQECLVTALQVARPNGGASGVAQREEVEKGRGLVLLAEQRRPNAHRYCSGCALVRDCREGPTWPIATILVQYCHQTKSTD